MKTAELRYGNLVRIKGEEGIMPIDCIQGDDTIRVKRGSESIGCFDVSMAEAIPLTEEWLLKFGFEKEDLPVHYRYKKDVYSVRFIGGRLFRFEMHEKALTQFYFVHELQNLYFALAGEELLIKP